jgi:hypothetical protein
MQYCYTFTCTFEGCGGAAADGGGFRADNDDIAMNVDKDDDDDAVLQPQTAHQVDQSKMTGRFPFSFPPVALPPPTRQGSAPELPHKSYMLMVGYNQV